MDQQRNGFELLNVKKKSQRSYSRSSIVSSGVLIVLACLAIAVVVWPLLLLILTIVQNASSVWSVLGKQDTLKPLLNTAITSVIATVIALFVGICSALLMQGIQRNFPRWQRWWQILLLLPLFMPPFIGAFSWLQAYARGGLSDELLHITFPWLYGPAGVIVLLAIHSAPIAYMTVLAALSRLDRRSLQAARMYGASPRTIFLQIILPVVRPTIIAALGLIFAVNAGDFGIPLILGVPGHFLTATTQIYQELSFLSSTDGFSVAMALSFILALGSLLILLLLQRIDTNQALLTPAEPVQDVRDAQRRGSFWFVSGMCVFSLYMIVIMIIPCLALLLTSLTTAYGLPPVPQNWTLAHFISIFNGDTLVAILHSVGLAAVVAIVIVLLGLLEAESARHTRLGRLLTRIVWLPYAIPGSVIGVAATLAYSRWFYGTLTIIFLAYLAKFWGMSEPLISARRQTDTGRWHAGRLFGAGRLLAYRIGIWPTIGGTALAIGVLVLINSVYELTMSSLLATPNSETIASIVLNAEEGGDVTTTATLAVLMMLLMVGSMLIVTGVGRTRTGQAKEHSMNSRRCQKEKRAREHATETVVN